MTIIHILAVFVISVLLSVAAVAVVLKLSRKKEWYDQIDERKIHSGEIPRLGGIGFALAFIVVTTASSLIAGPVEALFSFWPCVLAMLIMLASGAYDDFHPMAARYKLILQIAAALCLIIPGFIFKGVLYVETGFFTDLGWLSYPVTLLWIVGITNAVNLVDGVDGLAGGLSGIIAFFIGLIFYTSVDTSKAVLLCVCLVGVLAGFLVFNAPFPKAKIFMGDCGSQFLGLTLAMLPLVGENYGPTHLPVLYAAALFAIPIFDTIAAVWRRIREHKKIYRPDKSHLHHKLINLGLNALGVDIVLYTLQIIIGITVFISIRLDGLSSLLFLGAAYLIPLVFFSMIHFMNRAVMQKAKELPPD